MTKIEAVARAMHLELYPDCDPDEPQYPEGSPFRDPAVLNWMSEEPAARAFLAAHAVAGDMGLAEAFARLSEEDK